MNIHQQVGSTQSEQRGAITTPGGPGSEADALAAALADMTASFSSDFVDGRVGKRHNTFEHRSRVLRQMTGSLAAMRAQGDALAHDGAVI